MGSSSHDLNDVVPVAPEGIEDNKSVMLPHMLLEYDLDVEQ
jgi:hypothetical protein